MLDPAAYEAISIEVRDNGVALATLDRPDRLNAVNAVMHHELARITRDVAADPAVRVLVLTGAGRAFCAGGDFGPQSAATSGEMTLEEGRQIVDHLLECPKPVIAAVNGYAMGLGATIALLCDIVYAAESAVFADTHVRMGIGAGDGGQVIWPLLMGVNKAKYFLMTGDRVSAAEAERMNLVNFVVPDGTVVDEALALADRLAAGPAVAISASKMGINNFMRSVSSLVLPLSLSLEGASMHSLDHREAITAFQERREARFTGR